jgi:threonine/homoserine/homoserine lactone efflux protein
MASAPVFSAIRLGGAIYLVYFGLRSLWGAVVHRDAVARAEQHREKRISVRKAFTQGLASNLSNAKMVAFFVSLLPPFAGPHPKFLLLLALGLNFCLLTLAWLAGYALAVERISRLLHRSILRRAIDGVVGVVLTGLGVRISVEALPSP